MKRSMASFLLRKFFLFATIACIALVGCDPSSDPADDPPDDPPGGDPTNLIVNGTFDSQLDPWFFWVDTGTGAHAQTDTNDGTCIINISTGVNREYDVGLGQAIALTGDTIYRLTFDARAMEDDTIISASLEENGTDVNGDGETYGNWNRVWLNLSQETQRYSFTLVMPPGINDPTGRLSFWLDYLAAPNTITLDRIVLEKLTTAPEGHPPAPEMLRNGNFSEGINFWWWWSAAGRVIGPDCSTGSLILGNLNPGTPRGEMCIKARSPGLITAGVEYVVNFTASSTEIGDRLRIALCEGGTDLDGDSLNYSELDVAQVQLTTQFDEYEVRLVSPYTSPTIDMNTFFNGMIGTVVLDDISMKPAP